MSLLMWDKPKQIMSHEEYAEEHSSSAEATGTYASNMSDEDKKRWRARMIGGKRPRVEIRKELAGTKIVLVVTEIFEYTVQSYGRQEAENYNVRLSMNGPILATWQDWAKMQQAIVEARAVLAGAKP